MDRSLLLLTSMEGRVNDDFFIEMNHFVQDQYTMFTFYKGIKVVHKEKVAHKKMEDTPEVDRMTEEILRTVYKKARQQDDQNSN